jgi:hypothetical protein
VLRAFFGRVAAAVGNRFGFRTNDRPVPVFHEDVVLTEEGAKLWEEITQPNSPVGKPVHRRWRLPGEGAAQ